MTFNPLSSIASSVRGTSIPGNRKLYQLANGDMAFGLSQPTVSRIITRVSTAFRNKAFPHTLAQQEREQEGFYTHRRRIPKAIGCIDGSLVPVKTPSVNENAYVCRQQFHAINVQGVVHMI
jgi:hypothetical protein